LNVAVRSKRMAKDDHVSATNPPGRQRFRPCSDCTEQGRGTSPPAGAPSRLRVLPASGKYAGDGASQTAVTRLIRALIALVSVAFILSACTQTLDRAHDASEAENGSIAGYGEIRTYLDARLDEAPRDVQNWAPATNRNVFNALMISGGGA